MLDYELRGGLIMAADGGCFTISAYMRVYNSTTAVYEGVQYNGTTAAVHTCM